MERDGARDAQRVAQDALNACRASCNSKVRRRCQLPCVHAAPPGVLGSPAPEPARAQLRSPRCRLPHRALRAHQRTRDGA
jgi:hypothetical protein